MRIRKTLKGFNQGSDVSLIFSCPDEKVVRGKYVVGFHSVEKDHLVVVFDPSASFHRDIILQHKLRPRGGGWLEMNAKSRQIRLYGRSHAYGREAGRDLVRAVVSRAFPDFSCTCEP